jgi:C-terminal processing protease CtpA/Prc
MDETADLAGVGLGLVSEVVSGRPSVLNVNAIEPSGAAANSGVIMLGDTLCEVDDRDVSSMLPRQVKGLVMGVPGTSITLGLKRGSFGHPFYVRLTRSHPVPSSRVSDASAGNWPAAPLQASTDAASVQQSVDKHPTAPPPSVEQGGIGVGIALDTSGQLSVTSLTPGGPADRSELIKIGDILRSVDSHHIAGRSPAAVKPYIIGPVGSPLTLVVIRGRTPITVRLAREKDAEEEKDAQCSSLAGIGLVFVPDRAGALVVSGITEGGPAARTNLVRRGDVLKHIDGVDVYTWPMARVRPLIVGSAGSIVTLGMQVTFNARAHTQRLRQSF